MEIGFDFLLYDIFLKQASIQSFSIQIHFARIGWHVSCTWTQNVHKKSRIWFYFIILLFYIDLFWFKWNKIKINNKNNRIIGGKSQGSWVLLETCFKQENMGPFWKNANLINADFWQIPKNSQPWQCISPSIFILGGCYGTF